MANTHKSMNPWQTDIYESMAQGVQGAACVICFMSKKYQSSTNCKLEVPSLCACLQNPYVRID
jgi:hypothetical protein